jgi:ribonuclease HI
MFSSAHCPQILIENNVFSNSKNTIQYTGVTVHVFTGKVLSEQLKFKLDNRCSNSQAEQLAIVKVLEVKETQQVNNNEHGTAVIYTDSKVRLDSIMSANNHSQLVAEIRKRTVTLNKGNWKIELYELKLMPEYMETKSHIDLRRRQLKTTT